MGHVVHSGVSSARNVIALFSCSGGTGMDSTNIGPEHITMNLCFCIRQDLGSRSAFCGASRA
jgi:hypothetical protein